MVEVVRSRTPFLKKLSTPWPRRDSQRLMYNVYGSSSHHLTAQTVWTSTISESTLSQWGIRAIPQWEHWSLWDRLTLHLWNQPVKSLRPQFKQWHLHRANGKIMSLRGCEWSLQPPRNLCRRFSTNLTKTATASSPRLSSEMPSDASTLASHLVKSTKSWNALIPMVMAKLTIKNSPPNLRAIP